jgi:hypothetical protein
VDGGATYKVCNIEGRSRLGGRKSRVMVWSSYFRDTFYTSMRCQIDVCINKMEI